MNTPQSSIVSTRPINGPPGTVASQTPSSETLRRVVAERVDALIGATTARHDWLKNIGIQAPLQFAWMLSRAQRLSASHLDYLAGACFAELRTEAVTRAECVGTSMFRKAKLTKTTDDHAVLLYRSLSYSWVNYDLILALSEDWISSQTREVLDRFSSELRRLLDDLEAFDGSLVQGEAEDYFPGTHDWFSRSLKAFQARRSE